jgi:cholesterol transport system auxiliary component
MTSRQKALGFALAALLAPTGCTSLLPGQGEAPQLYVLTPKTTFPPDLPVSHWQLLVDVPVAPAEIDNTRIALSRTPTTLDYFANAAWADRAPVMVQSLLVESFERTGKITAIARESAALRADYILQPELRHFQALYDGPGGTAQSPPPVVRAHIIARLIKMPERAIVAKYEVDRREPATRNDMPAIVEAFDEALGGAMKEIVVWTLTSPDGIASR